MLTQLATRLTGRSLVRVAGADSPAFLQGLLTNDVAQDHQLGQLRAALLLNAAGRVVLDTLCLRVAETEYQLEVATSQVDTLMRLLRRYRLRSQVSLEAQRDADVAAVVFTCASSVAATQLPSSALCDPRFPASIHAYRVYHLDAGFPLDPANDPARYHACRVAYAVPEGPTELPPLHALPLEGNAVDINAISFDKGCYVGQELTARTHWTGVVRRKLVPVRLLASTPGSSLDDTEAACDFYPGSDLIPSWFDPSAAPADLDVPLDLQVKQDPADPSDASVRRRGASGQLRSVYGNIGLALLRQSHALSPGVVIRAAAHGLRVYPLHNKATASSST